FPTRRSSDLRWSLTEADKVKTNAQLNSRFIILDPNGEYFDAFNDLGSKKVRKFTIKLDDSDTDFEQLKIPAWMWNSQEWISFSQAAPGAQRPLLLQSLLNLKRGAEIGSSKKIRLNSFLKSSCNSLVVYFASVPTGSRNPAFIEMCRVLENISSDLKMHRQFVEIDELENYEKLISDFDIILANRSWAAGRYNPFSFEDINSMHQLIDVYLKANGETITPIDSINPDTPTPFQLDDLIPHLEQLAQNQGGNIVQFVQMLSLRMRFLFSDERLNGVVQPKEDITLLDWLN